MGDGLIGGLSNILGLDAILDPGRNERRRAADMQDRAADLWLQAGEDAPRWQDIDASAGGNALSSLDGDRGYQAGQEAQLRALRGFQGIADSGGYTALERQQIRAANAQAADQERSQRLAALQQMAARGMSGGGAEMAARLQAQQSGANRAARSATDIATAAQQRALQAMQAGAQIGANQEQQGQVRAGAIDAFNRANAESRARAHQQQYENRMAPVAGLSGQYNQNASSAYQQAQNQAQNTQALGNMILSGYAASQSGGGS